jgi:hypothetical protein
MKIIEELITNAGCKLEYLPPYSPDYNPIEYTFSVIKCHFKKQGGIVGNETAEELGEKALKICDNGSDKRDGEESVLSL